MDRLSIISGALFFAANVFAVTSLAMPDWIVTENGGTTRLGLMQSCLTIYNRPTVCYTPTLSSEWWITLIAILAGCLCVTSTLVLLFISIWERQLVHVAKWFRQVVRLCCSYIFLCCGSCVSDGVQARGDRRRSLPASKLIQCWNFLHFLRDGLVDNGHLRTLRKQNLFAAFLAWSLWSLGVKETLE